MNLFVGLSNVLCLSYSGAWTSYFMDLLSLRLIGEVRARIYVKSTFSRWALSLTIRVVLG